jgi:hypothetical protein
MTNTTYATEKKGGLRGVEGGTVSTESRFDTSGGPSGAPDRQPRWR